MKNYDKCINLAGIRFDEKGREGLKLLYSMEQAEAQAIAAFPFVDLEIEKDHVFDILDKSIGIPDTYQYRSRSGCFSCYYQRTQEIIGMYFHHRKNFEKTASYERLCNEDKSRWGMAEVLRDQGIRGFYPCPDFVDINTSKGAFELPEPKVNKVKVDTTTDDIFGSQKKTTRIYAAFALYIHPMLAYYSGQTSGSYGQEFISFSTSMPGLKASLKTYHDFRRTTPSPLASFKHMHIVIVVIDFEEGVLDVKGPSSDSYTWKSAVAYKQIAHIVSHIQNTLEAVEAHRDFAKAKHAVRTAKHEDAYLDAREWLGRALWMRKKIKKGIGKLVWEGLYRAKVTSDDGEQLSFNLGDIQPKKRIPRSGLDFDEVQMACLTCSL